MVKGLLMASFMSFNLHSIGDFDEFLDLHCDLFLNEASLCRQFIEHDLSHPKRGVLYDLARRNFPYQFEPFIRIMTSLCGDADTALEICNKLMEMDYFSCPMNVYQLFEQRLVAQLQTSMHKQAVVVVTEFDMGGIAFHRNVKGFVHVVDGETIIQWEVCVITLICSLKQNLTSIISHYY